ncbi:MAG: putative Ig domain-containing protein [Methylococcaceae bacterium]|jgi:hypothetical protein
MKNYRLLPGRLMFGLAISMGSIGGAQASTAYGALGNFDAVNDTGEITYGFEIEVDDALSKDIGGTYSYNHYGAPKIREDNTTPGHPKVFIRYEVPAPSGSEFGLAAGHTNAAVPGVIAPTQGHQCTDPSVNIGCEHFGVGIYSRTYTAVKYNWLIKDAAGNNVTGPAVNVSTPIWTGYVPAVIAKPAVVAPNPIPNQPPVVVVPAIVQIPAQIIPVIPAPIVAQPVIKEFGEPSWVKVIKTKTHSRHRLALEELIGDDNIKPGVPDWANGEPAEVESEWYLLQTNSKKPGAKSELAGKPENLGDGEDAVTRRYEFYAYAGPSGLNGSVDGESGEAMCDAVQTDPTKGIVGNGVGTVSVTDANGDSYEFDCSSVAVVGDYRGVQMGQFNAIAPLDLIDNIQDGKVAEAYPQRRIPNGGNTPYLTTISGGVLPNGLVVESETGILSGTPSKVGVFNFNANVTDADNKTVSKPYTVKITGPGDVDLDNDIDLADIAVIKARYGQAAVAKDPADVNGDLRIDLVDYRKAASLCTKPRCALVTP